MSENIAEKSMLTSEFHFFCECMRLEIPVYSRCLNETGWICEMKVALPK